MLAKFISPQDLTLFALLMIEVFDLAEESTTAIVRYIFKGRCFKEFVNSLADAIASRVDDAGQID